MAASLEIGRDDQQSPRISFISGLSQTETERKTDDWESPRVSFSVYVSQSDSISPEKRKRDDVADINCGTDFEFSVNGRNSIISETHCAIADELFVDGKMLPPIHGPVQAQPRPIARHVNVERLGFMSPDRYTSSPSTITSSCWGNVAHRSLGYKPSKKLKEILFKPSNKENVCAENKRTLCKEIEQSQSSSSNSVLSFSRTCRKGGEMKGNSLFRSLPFSRSESTAERKLKGATSGCTSTEKQIDVLSVVQGSKPLEGWSISKNVQREPQCYCELKPRSEAAETRGEANGKQYSVVRGNLSSCGVPASGMRRGVGGQRSSRRFSGDGGMSMVPKVDSPPPGKPIVMKGDNSMQGGVRVGPVLNVGGSWNGGGGLFGFFSKTEKKHHQSSAFPRTGSKLGT